MERRVRRIAAVAALLLAGAPLDARAQTDASDLPGMRLAARLESYLAEHGDALRREHLEHYALIGPVEKRDLRRWVAPMAPRPDGDAWVLAAGNVPELHGGAVLAFLFRYWRPDDREARPGDRYPFLRQQASLGAIQAGHARQTYLPVPGRRAEAIAGALPDRPQLPRMLFFAANESIPTVERDAYSFLRLLVVREDDFGEEWTNHFGQELSVDRLLRNAWNHYLLRRGGLEAEASDHSNLHLVEVLLAYSRKTRARPTLDPAMVQRRFLAVELARPVASTPAENLAHYAESLGFLVADDRVKWPAEESAAAQAWLAQLERDRFADLDTADPNHLAHLLHGLRNVRSHRARLAAP